MSDPIAVSLLSKLTSWYDFEGNLNDSFGRYNLTGSFVSGYEAGKVGQSLKKGSRALAMVASTPISSGSGMLTVGGWFLFPDNVSGVANFGLTTTPAIPANELFFTYNSADNGKFGVYGFSTDVTESSDGSWRVEDPSNPSIRYPFTVKAVDAGGRIATSKQVINIQGDGLAPGWYFVVCNFNKGAISVYLNAQLKASGNAPENLKSPITAIQIANQYTNTVSAAGMDSSFFSLGSFLSADEIAWLYNDGQGRSYADLVSGAA